MNVKLLTTLLILALPLAGCDKLQSASGSSSNSSASSLAGGNFVAGNGGTVAGQGAFSGPTSMGVAARITNGLQNNVSMTSGNFSNAYTQVKGNLPQVTDPTQCTGYDQVELLVYAACSDLTGGSTPLMKSKYMVDPKATIATNQAALVQAGVQMLDQYAAGLASQGPASSAVSSTFTTLVQQIMAVSSNSSTVAFMSVCIAANTTGSTMLGF